jgi:predicted ferric reductase
MEESTTPKVSLAQHAAKWGAIIGGGSIVLTLLIYIVDYTLLADWKMIVLLLVFLGLVIYAGINYRNQIGGFLPYGKAFQHAFITFAVLGIVSTAFTVILYTVIDSELPAKLTEVALENTQKMMENFGVPEDQMDKAMEDAKERSADQFYAILSLIGALFVRKNEPVEF